MVDIGLLVIRLAVGLVIAAHGAQKVFGWFNGPGMRGFTGMMSKLGLRPAPFWAWTAALTELLGGLALALGIFTPVVGAMLFGSFVVAAVTVHLGKGFWNTNGGIEFPLTLGITSLALAISGAGLISLDGLLRLAPAGPYLVVIALMVAVIGTIAALESRQLFQGGTRQPASH